MSKHETHISASSKVGKKNKHFHKLGASISLLCGIHCLLTPFVVTAMPFAGKEILGNEALEAVIMIFSVGLAAFMLTKDHLKKHGKYSALMLLAFGVFILFYSYFSHSHGHAAHIGHDHSHGFFAFEPAMMSALGGFIIFGAFLLNWHLGRQYHTCKAH